MRRYKERRAGRRFMCVPQPRRGTGTMWKTQDGYTLRLPQPAVQTIATRLRQTGLSDLVRRNYRGSGPLAIARSVAQLARNAECVGFIRSPRSGSRYQVFSAQ